MEGPSFSIGPATIPTSTQPLPESALKKNTANNTKIDKQSSSSMPAALPASTPSTLSEDKKVNEIKKIKIEGKPSSARQEKLPISKPTNSSDSWKNNKARRINNESSSYLPKPENAPTIVAPKAIPLFTVKLIPLEEKVRMERFNIYAPLRARLRDAVETKKFFRVPSTLKIFKEMVYQPEPETLELLADVLEIEDKEKNKSVCKQLRIAAEKLRVKDDGLANPVGYLKSCMGSLRDGYHLITSKEVSQPKYTSSKMITGQDGQDVWVVEVRIRLASCAHAKMYTMEVVERASEPCDEKEIEPEIGRRKTRLYRAAALKALATLRGFILEAQKSN